MTQEPDREILAGEYVLGLLDGAEKEAFEKRMAGDAKLDAATARWQARLAPIFDRMRRSENRNVQIVSKPGELAPLTGRMDIVLVDAPCTGSGTWRRRPDTKWRLSQKQLDARRGEQASILDAASAFVRPGGLLVYITCSVFEEENGDQVAAFRERRDGFSPVDHRQLWDIHFPDHSTAARVADAGGISLSPALSGTDGFYFHALRRTV